MKFEAIYHDGTTSSSELVVVTVSEDGSVSFSLSSPDSEGLNTSLLSDITDLSWSELKVQPRIGQTPRWIRLPNHAQLETKENDLVDQIQERFKQGVFDGFLHRTEHSWWMVFCGLLISVLFIWGSVQYGLPVAANLASKAIPADVLNPLGEEVIVWMDDNLFEPSTLSDQRQAEIRNEFEQLFQAQAHYTLLFRASPKIGANALALPNNTIILTDELVNLAENDQQILAVLAHEVGHIVHKHALRRLLQQAGLAAILMTFTGDVSSVSSAVAYLPALLIELGYSRDFEYEADEYALQFMSDQGMDKDHLARALEVLHQHHAGEDEGDASNHSHDDDKPETFDYLSTHPTTDVRVEKIRNWQ